MEIFNFFRKEMDTILFGLLAFGLFIFFYSLEVNREKNKISMNELNKMIKGE